MIGPPAISRRRFAAGSALASILCAALLLATSPGLPMVWDEGNAILRAEAIPQQWPYTTRGEGHPAFYGIVIAAGTWIAPPGLSRLDAARFGPIMLFAFAAGAMFYRMGRDYSLTAAIGAVAALMLLPRMFAHAHFASFDGPLTSCWILAWAAFPGGMCATASTEAVPSGGKGGLAPWRRLFRQWEKCRRHGASPLFSAPVAETGTGTVAASRLPKAWRDRGDGASPLFSVPVAETGTGTVAASRFPKAWRDRGDGASPLFAVLWGIALGMTFSCKATGWLAPLPFVAWAAICRDRRAAKTLGMGLPVALVTFFALNPPLWHDPLRGWTTFFDLNVHRAAQPGLNISIQFLGQMYNLDHPLPWYNTLFWVAVTVPLGMLLLSGVGLAAVLRRWRTDTAGVLLAANWLVLLVVRALPGTPPHDGTRLFLPSFAFLAALAGVGCAAVMAWATGPARPRLAKPWHAMVLLIALFAASASSLVCYAPQWLSYYNLLIGGLPGATALGMEPTYYWDGLDQSVFDWLHAHTAEDEKVSFAAISPENLELFHRWGVLRRQTADDAPGEFRWYVLQRRPSGLQPADLRLIERARPVFRKVIRRGGFGPWRLDVPLVEVYRYEDYAEAERAGGG